VPVRSFKRGVKSLSVTADAYCSTNREAMNSIDGRYMMCDVDVVMEFCDVYVVVKRLVEEHQAVKNKTLIAPGKLCKLLMMAVSLVACALCNVMEVKSSCKEEFWGVESCMHEVGWDLPRKRSCQIKSGSERRYGKEQGKGSFCIFSKHDGYTRPFDREVTIDSRG